MQTTIVRDPIYKQVSTLIKEEINKEEYSIGDKFLSEREIGERFSISRATANKALSCLVAEGILEYRKGLGTFIRTKVLEYDLRSLVSFTEKATAVGKIPSTRVLEFKRMQGTEIPVDAREHLDTRDSEEVFFISRSRLADNVPVILEKRYVPSRLCPDLAESDLEQSIYRLFTEKFGFSIAGADETIRAVTLRRADAEYLETKAGRAALLVLSLGFLDDRRSLWWEETLYRGDLYEFRNTLGPIKAPGPAVGFIRDSTGDAI